MESEKENNNEMTTLIPIEEEKESEYEQENEDCDKLGQDSYREEGGDAPSLVSETDIRSTQISREPEIYNPSSGQSYLQYCHNLVK